jgi:CHAD domain-containing protein
MSGTVDLRPYLGTLLADLDRHLAAYGEKQGRGSLHKFRVTAKYTRSLLRFLATRKGGGKAEKALADLRRIFAMAGQVREHQLLLQWMHLHRKPELARHFSAEKEYLKSVGRLLRELTGFLSRLKVHAAALDKLTGRVTADDMKDYRSGILDGFLLRLEAGILPGRWHGARKRIKTLQHLEQWPGLRLPPSKSKGAWEGKLEVFQVAVGAWHDTGDMIAWLHDRAKSVKNDPALLREWESALLLLERQYGEQYDAVHVELEALKKLWLRRRSKNVGAGKIH